MSRTRKDRPDWVRAHADAEIAHDHRLGVCAVETLRDARASAGGAYRRAHRCAKLTWARVFCVGPCGAAATPTAVCCGHRQLRYRADAACRCDQWPTRPTCAPPRPARFRGTPPWVRARHRRSERARGRNWLREAVKTANAEPADTAAAAAGLDFADRERDRRDPWW